MTQPTDTGANPLDRVRTALARAGSHQTRESGDWTCPAHPDRSPSLSISLGRDGRVLLHCHAGCEPAAILERLDLTFADLAPAEPNGNGVKPGHHEPLAVYPYRDEQGRLLYEVLRFEGKEFRQRRPKEGGGWEWSIKGVRRVPYRLPEVLAAVAAGRPVFVVEGEKDVHAVEWAGQVATCNSGGAGKWDPAFAELLTGAKVVIVRDQDPPGTKHAADVEASLSGKARKVIVVDPAEGKDAADHLVTHGLDEWLAQLEPAALNRTMLGALMRSGVPEPTRWHDWLYAGGLHTIQSEPGVGKSWIALWLALHLIAAGYAVVYIDEEGGEELVTERLIALGADPDAVDGLLWYFPFPERQWTDDDLAALRSVIAAAGANGTQVAAGILDSLPDFLASADIEENSGKDTTRFIRRLLRPFREVDAALLVLDHLIKPPTDDTAGTNRKKRSRYARGSGAKLAKAHLTVLVESAVEFDRNTSGQLRVWKTKDRRGRVALPYLSAPPLVLDVTVRDGRVVIAPGADVPTGSRSEPQWSGPTRCMDAVRALLQREPGTQYTATQMAKLLIDPDTRHGYRKDTVIDSARLLAAEAPSPEGRVRVISGPRNSILYWWQEGDEDAQEMF